MGATLKENLKYTTGAFSSTTEKSKASGAEIGVDPARVYGSWAEMLEREAALPDDLRSEIRVMPEPKAETDSAA